jgi:hypothetical protein
MFPPTLSDFNYKLDDHCFFAEENSKVMRLAHRMQVLESLQAHEGEAIMLSYFYTDRKKILDLVLFVSVPESPQAHPISCFYFKDFLRRSYDIGSRLRAWIPADLLVTDQFQKELLSALNFLLPEIYPQSEARLYRSRDAWGFTFARFAGQDLPCEN